LQLECQLLKKEKEDAPRRSGADEYEITGSYNDGPACNQGAFFNRGVPASLAGLSSLMEKMPAMLGVNVNTGARIKLANSRYANPSASRLRVCGFKFCLTPGFPDTTPNCSDQDLRLMRSP
jgi:hypothetical protein